MVHDEVSAQGAKSGAVKETKSGEVTSVASGHAIGAGKTQYSKLNAQSGLKARRNRAEA
ncbi:hypothetical protein [Paraburkholderia hayleyella]|uniref:hypothetical protein n=1 Tax=Paraburkholderia hayleyella TaxID=2152889 RepID=UPI00129215DD|nr:hypothetical protein [Paraburkholderia hayleyella]